MPGSLAHGEQPRRDRPLDDGYRSGQRRTRVAGGTHAARVHVGRHRNHLYGGRGRFPDISPVPAVDSLVQRLKANPDLARWASELAVRDAEFTLARARRIPNPSIIWDCGVKDSPAGRFRDSEATGRHARVSRTDVEPERDAEYRIVLGFSMPLPLFDRNQGNIAEAEALVSKTAEERRATAVALHAALVESRESAAAAYDELQTLETDVLARAAQTLDKTREGYELGKFSHLHVLDAQRTLFDAQAARLDALTRYHVDSVNIERLTGQTPAQTQEQQDEREN